LCCCRELLFSSSSHFACGCICRSIDAISCYVSKHQGLVSTNQLITQFLITVLTCCLSEYVDLVKVYQAHNSPGLCTRDVSEFKFESKCCRNQTVLANPKSDRFSETVTSDSVFDFPFGISSFIALCQ